MEKTRNNLKAYSIIILAFAAITLIVEIVTLCVKGLPIPATLPAGVTQEFAKITVIITCAISFVIYIPQFYVGLKGLKIANGENVSVKGPKVWAVILAVLAIIATISALSSLFKAFNFDTFMNVLDPAVDVLLYVCYFFCVKKIAG